MSKVLSFVISLIMLTVSTGLSPIVGISQTEKDFEDDKRPSHRVSGGSRNPCTEVLLALVPGDGEITEEGCQPVSRSFPTMTMTDQPVIWVYVPEQPRSDVTAEFVLIDRNDSPQLKQSVFLVNTPGIIGIPLAEPLQPDEEYRWAFTVQHNPNKPTQNPTVEGFIQQGSLDLEVMQQVAQSQSPQERIHLYAQSGFWYDALTLAAQARCEGSKDDRMATEWQDLLVSAGFRAFGREAIVNCRLLFE